MARTKQEVRSWLEKQVNNTLSDPQGDWTGECVTLIKCLMDFLGVPNPYAARGHAKDAANTYLAQGIADNGKGWLTICVNSTWGSGYGHIWADLQNEHSYEQNGKVYHVVTKDTKKISSATQWVNFDKWIKEEDVVDDATARAMLQATTILAVDGTGESRQPTKQEVENLIGRTPLDALNQIMSYQPWKDNLAKVVYYKQDVSNAGGFTPITEQLYKKG